MFHLEPIIACIDFLDSLSASLQDGVELSSLKKLNGRVYYRGRWWTPNKPVPSTAKGKKKMVLATKEGKVKIIHFGAKGYKHNYSEKAKKSYLARSAGIGNLRDPWSANYWSRKVLWPKNKPVTG